MYCKNHKFYLVFQFSPNSVLRMHLENSNISYNVNFVSLPNTRFSVLFIVLQIP